MASSINVVPPRIALTLIKGEDIDLTLMYTVLLVDGSGDPILDGDGKKQ